MLQGLEEEARQACVKARLKDECGSQVQICEPIDVTGAQTLASVEQKPFSDDRQSGRANNDASRSVAAASTGAATKAPTALPVTIDKVKRIRFGARIEDSSGRACQWDTDRCQLDVPAEWVDRMNSDDATTKCKALRDVGVGLQRLLLAEGPWTCSSSESCTRLATWIMPTIEWYLCRRSKHTY